MTCEDDLVGAVESSPDLSQLPPHWHGIKHGNGTQGVCRSRLAGAGQPRVGDQCHTAQSAAPGRHSRAAQDVIRIVASTPQFV